MADETRFTNRSAQEILKEALTLWAGIPTQSKELVVALHYLDKTGLYRTIPGYKKQDFRVFLDEALNMTHKRYMDLYAAWAWYPEESRTFGPHIVKEIEREVGKKNLPKVLAQLKTVTEKKGNSPSRRQIAIFVARFLAREVKKGGK